MAAGDRVLLEAEATRWKDLFAEVTEACSQNFDSLCKAHPDLGRAPLDAALLQTAVIAIRNMKVTLHLMDAGWWPETRSLVRTVWEATVDMAYLMRGANRNEKAKLYHAMALLRVPNLLGNRDPKNIASARSAFPGFVQAEQVYGSHDGIDPKNHWSGERTGEIRKLADEYISEKLGPRGSGFLRKSQGALFRGGSSYVHADPAIWVDTGRLEMRQRIVARLAIQSGVHSMAACTGAVLALIPIADRNGELPAALSIVDEYERVLRDFPESAN